MRALLGSVLMAVYAPALGCTWLLAAKSGQITINPNAGAELAAFRTSWLEGAEMQELLVLIGDHIVALEERDRIIYVARQFEGMTAGQILSVYPQVSQRAEPISEGRISSLFLAARSRLLGALRRDEAVFGYYMAWRGTMTNPPGDFEWWIGTILDYLG